MILDLIIAAAFLCSMLHIRLLKEVRYLGIPFILKWDGRQFIPTNQQRVAAIHSKKHTPKLIAGKSIVVYYMTWEALSPSPFAFTSSGLTRLG